MSENQKCPVSTDLTQNIEEMEFYFHDCADIKKKQMKLGRNQDTACYLTFIEVSVDMGTSALGETLKYLNGLRSFVHCRKMRLEVRMQHIFRLLRRL